MYIKFSYTNDIKKIKNIKFLILVKVFEDDFF